MFNLLRMDVYRLFRTRSLWVCLIVMLGMVVLAIGVLALVSNENFINGVTSGGFVIGITDTDELESIAAAPELLPYNMDYLGFLGNMAVSGQLVGIFLVIFVALFIAGEFESGFAKNVFSVSEGRIAYFFSKAITLLVVVVFYMLTTSIVSLIGAFIAGFDLQPSAIGDIAIWTLLSVATFWALSMLVAMLAWVFKSKTGALVIGLLVVTGMIGSILGSILGVFPDIAFLSNYLLSSSWIYLQQGLSTTEASDLVRIAAMGGGYLVLFSALSILVLQKEDI